MSLLKRINVRLKVVRSGAGGYMRTLQRRCDFRPRTCVLMTATRSFTLRFSQPQRAQDGSSWRSGPIDYDAATVTSVQII